ncbi:MAG TPA: hypothetical protein PLO50_00880 [Nitrospira sp.]|nr:hypothetical protein [Nitrospira sp.]
MAAIKTIPDLAKSYVSAQKLIGQNRLPAPAENWTDKEWNDLFGKIGRPETPDGYEFPKDVQLKAGLEFDKEKTKAAFTELHKLGLTKKQAEGVMRHYLSSVNSTAEAEETARQQAYAAGTEKLRRTHGDRYDAVVGVAKGVLTKFGGEEVTNMLTSMKLDSNPDMVEFLYKIGQAMSEDTMRSGGGSSLPVGDAATALNEITKLESDPEFQKAYNDRAHPKHNDAVDRMVYLNRIAFPGKVQ